jgi:hypothetical protein
MHWHVDKRVLDNIIKGMKGVSYKSQDRGRINSLPDLPVWQLSAVYPPLSPHPAVTIILAVVATSLLIFLVSPAVKQSGYEADHSPPSHADIKNRWSYTSTSLYVFMVSTETTFLFTHILYVAVYIFIISAVMNIAMFHVFLFNFTIEFCNSQKLK